MGVNDPSVRMNLKSAEFNTKLMRVQNVLDKIEGPAYVRAQARRLVKKWAFLAPIKTGRLRAGFWPAAMALQITSIYTPHPNAGEGLGINNTYDQKRPSMTIVNAVPYVANAGGRGTSWWFQGMNAIMARMDKDLESHVERAWKAGG